MKPQYGELISILVIGLLQPVIEILWNSRISTYYNGIAVVLVLGYVIVRILRTGGSVLHLWGLRVDNLRQCLFPYLVLTAIGGVAVYGYGWFAGNTPLPVGFWYLLMAYPIWGIAQQFVLQNFVAKNLTTLVPSIATRSLVTAVLFACAHIPSVELVIVTFVAGLIFTVLYHSYPNLLVLGFVHGILGALVFHLVLGQNQWMILIQYFL
jgi:hypothetical protein